MEKFGKEENWNEVEDWRLVVFMAQGTSSGRDKNELFLLKPFSPQQGFTLRPFHRLAGPLISGKSGDDLESWLAGGGAESTCLIDLPKQLLPRLAAF